MSDTHYLGEFQSLSAVWKMFPNGAGYGDYITIGGVRYDWDESTNSWGEDPGDVNPALPEIVNHDIDVQGTVIARDGIKTADYIPDEAGAHIDHAGNAEFRTLKADTIRLQDPLTGKLIPLAEFIKMFKTELPPDWSEYAQIPQFDDVRILAFDPVSDEKFYTTIGALKQLIRDSIAAGGVGTGTFDIEILRTDDPDAIPTDNNVMSSLRTLMAIQAAIAPLTGEYLSRINDDTAQGIITFLQGVVAAGTSQFVNLIASGKITAANIDVNDTLSTEILRVITQAYLQDAILKGQLNSETFSSGMLGNGFRLKFVDGGWVMELDKIVVRKAMEIFEIIVQRVRYQGGQVIHSPAGARLTAVTDGGSYWKCEHDGAVDFIADAQVLCQNFNIGSRQQNPDGSQTLSGLSVKRYWRRVTSYGTGWFNLSKTDCEAGSGTPEVSDEVVVLGHRSNPDWQNAILIASTGGNTPYIAHYAGINTFSLVGKEVVREGNLQGIVDEDFGQLAGYGLYSNNVYLKGVFRLLTGKTVEEAIGEIDGDLSEYKTYVQSEFNLLPDKISMEVSKIRIGGKNLLRNYDQRFGFDYWYTPYNDWEQGGFEDNLPSETMFRIRTPYVDLAPGDHNIHLHVDYKVEALFFDEYHVFIENSGWKYDGEKITAPSGTKYARFSVTFILDEGEAEGDDENKKITSAEGINFKVVQFEPIDESGTPVAAILTILGYSYIEPITVNRGGVPLFPSSIILSISDGTKRVVSATWSAVDTSEVGIKVSYATYDLPVGITGDAIDVSVIVNVTIGALMIEGYVPIAPTAVYTGEIPSLPALITLNLNDTTTRIVNATWTVDTSTPGEKTAIATYNMPGGVTGVKIPVTMTVVVYAITIVSVSQPQPVYVQVGNSPNLPSSVSLTLNYGSNRTVPVTWSEYSTDVEGEFTLTGSYDLPQYVTGSKPLVTLSLIVQTDEIPVTITSVDIPSQVTVPVNGIPTLPLTITLNLSDFTSTQAAVIWGDYDTSTEGTYNIVGSYDLPEGVTGSKPAVSISIVVSASIQALWDKIGYVRSLDGVSTPLISDWDIIANSLRFSAAIRDGKLYTWGRNNTYQLGLGDTIDRLTPTQVGEDEDWQMVSLGVSHGVALKAGKIYTWGLNQYGQLGTGDNDTRQVPTLIEGSTTWQFIEASGSQSYAITDGKLYSWGDNSYGKLGLYDNTNRNVPTRVGTYTTWSKVSSGDNFAIGIADNALYVWGLNIYGQLGLGNTTEYRYPVHLPGFAGASHISAGANHVAVIKSGTLYTWGYGANGRLGTGDENNRLSPYTVGSGYISTSAGGGHTLAVKNDGVYGFGSGANGEFGNNITTDILTPTQLTYDAYSILAGVNTSFFNDNGVLYGCGYNYFGQLGMGDTDTKTIITLIGDVQIELNENNSGVNTLTGSIISEWSDQVAYLQVNNQSAGAVSFRTVIDDVESLVTLSAGVGEYAIPITGATSFGLNGTDYSVIVYKYVIGRYGVKPEWYGI